MLTHATTWLDLKHMILSERSKTQKATYSKIPFIQRVQKRQIHRDRKLVVAILGRGVCVCVELMTE